LKPGAGVQLGSYVEAEGKELFELTKEKGMEGIIAKRKDSIYRPGKRTSDWLKIKARLQQEFVVGGFTAPKGSRKYLGASGRHPCDNVRVVVTLPRPIFDELVRAEQVSGVYRTRIAARVLREGLLSDISNRGMSVSPWLMNGTGFAREPDPDAARPL
jgi:ATP-dependent DNA ligase